MYIMIQTYILPEEIFSPIKDKEIFLIRSVVMKMQTLSQGIIKAVNIVLKSDPPASKKALSSQLRMEPFLASRATQNGFVHSAVFDLRMFLIYFLSSFA